MCCQSPHNISGSMNGQKYTLADVSSYMNGPKT